MSIIEQARQNDINAAKAAQLDQYHKQAQDQGLAQQYYDAGVRASNENAWLQMQALEHAKRMQDHLQPLPEAPIEQQYQYQVEHYEPDNSQSALYDYIRGR